MSLYINKRCIEDEEEITAIFKNYIFMDISDTVLLVYDMMI